MKIWAGWLAKLEGAATASGESAKTDPPQSELQNLTSFKHLFWTDQNVKILLLVRKGLVLSQHNQNTSKRIFHQNSLGFPWNIYLVPTCPGFGSSADLQRCPNQISLGGPRMIFWRSVKTLVSEKVFVKDLKEPKYTRYTFHIDLLEGDPDPCLQISRLSPAADVAAQCCSLWDGIETGGHCMVWCAEYWDGTKTNDCLGSARCCCCLAT